MAFLRIVVDHHGGIGDPPGDGGRPFWGCKCHQRSSDGNIPIPICFLINPFRLTPTAEAWQSLALLLNLSFGTLFDEYGDIFQCESFL